MKVGILAVVGVALAASSAMGQITFSGLAGPDGAAFAFPYTEGDFEITFRDGTLNQDLDFGNPGASMQVASEFAGFFIHASGGQTFTYDDLADPELNIRYGTYYLDYLLEQYGGNVVAALAAYNAGPGNADLWGGIDLQVEDIQFAETRAYVEEVLELRDQYRDNYAEDLGIE